MVVPIFGLALLVAIGNFLTLTFFLGGNLSIDAVSLNLTFTLLTTTDYNQG